MGLDDHGNYGRVVVAKVSEHCTTGDPSALKYNCKTLGLDSRCETHEIIRQLYNAAKRANVSLPWPQCVKADDGWQIHFFVVPKRAGRGHVLKTYGTDRSNWAYDPRKKDS